MVYFWIEILVYFWGEINKGEGQWISSFVLYDVDAIVLPVNIFEAQACHV
jgi:hypothetical protein